jgi:hypothetical protein
MEVGVKREEAILSQILASLYTYSLIYKAVVSKGVTEGEIA